MHGKRLYSELQTAHAYKAHQRQLVIGQVNRVLPKHSRFDFSPSMSLDVYNNNVIHVCITFVCELRMFAHRPYKS